MKNGNIEGKKYLPSTCIRIRQRAMPQGKMIKGSSSFFFNEKIIPKNPKKINKNFAKEMKNLNMGFTGR